MNAAYMASMSSAVDRLEAEKDEITGVMIASAKKTFFAGGDLNDLRPRAVRTSTELSKFIRDAKSYLRRLETSVSRSSRRSTAPRSAAAWRSVWPPITG